MTENEFIETLERYSKKIMDGFVFCFHFERICDWYEKYPLELNQYVCFLGSSTITYRVAFLNVFTALFDGNSNETILKLFEKAKDESWADKIINAMYLKYKKIMICDKDKTKRLDIVNKVSKWRNKFYDHFDKEAIYISDFQLLLKNNDFDFEDVADLMLDLHNDINLVFEKMGHKKYKKLPLNCWDIDNLFMDILKIPPEDAPELDKVLLKLCKNK